jgi:hypothetical protein
MHFFALAISESSKSGGLEAFSFFSKMSGLALEETISGSFLNGKFSQKSDDGGSS